MGKKKKYIYIYMLPPPKSPPFVLFVVNKTDEEFKQSGASINMMDIVCKKFNLKARLYDIDSNLICKHDPVNFNSDIIITFNGLIKHSHIYTLKS